MSSDNPFADMPREYAEQLMELVSVICGAAFFTQDHPDKIIHYVMDEVGPLPDEMIDNLYTVINRVRTDPLSMLEAQRKLRQELLP